MLTATNPVLDLSGLPRFEAFKPEYVTPAVDELLEANRALIEQLAAFDGAPTWENFVAPLEDANEKLHRAWGQVGHLNAVMNSPELREVYNANLPKITQYYTELGQNQGLFGKFKQLRAAPDFARLNRAQRAIIDHELRDFRLGGAELPAEKKARFLAIREKLSTVSSRFSDNLLDATNAFAHYVESESGLAGIPADVVQTAREAAQRDGKPGWKLTLHAPSYLPVMQYADDRVLRELIYRAYSTRAAEFGNQEWDNTALITEIVALRRELAQLLGFASFAEYSLEPKMAESPQQVLQFLNELAARARPYAERDLAELKQFAREELALPELEAWDIAYASEKLRAARYAFSDQEVKQYFPETSVLPGMFRLIETLYGLTIAPDGAPRWHPDVRFFSIRDRENRLVGQFYIDLYARPSKRGGAWMDDAITRRRITSGIQTPVAYLTCNFAAPVGGKPALFTHDEVITLFHEFGHGLHHLLTRIEELGASGINGVEWDAVELPSQFMENFCWEWDVLAPMTRHVDTGTPLPRALFAKMLAAKNFQSGLQTLRQIEFSLFDMHLHYDFDPHAGKSVAELLDEVRRRVAVIFPPAFNRFAHSFTHVFAGGYAAGYYSYKWAEVLSADAYSLFEERGVLDAATGSRFRDEILAVGGSRPALESFVAFRGREPKIDALLRHSGMVAT
ncbi:MAG: M3 family metallopeptidase [Betaproteobacteria bacterium]|nr:M3 family metallopeptidase [Betaproteobacteria bacterium]